MVIALPGALHAQSDTNAKTAAPAYSAAQADRGQLVYKNECGRCHSEKDHASADFQLNWNGRTARALFEYLKSTMPDDSPGELPEKSYLDVTAYIMKLNGMPAGDSALVADTTVTGKVKLMFSKKP